MSRIPTATHEGEIQIGEAIIPCAVLEDGTRVLTQRGFMVAIGRQRNIQGGLTGEQTPPFLAGKSLQPFIGAGLLAASKPIKFTTMRGTLAFGYRAEILPEVCNVFLSARAAGVLPPTQKHIAEACEIVVRGLATLGIIALVDERTGYQETRPRDALARILEEFIAKELVAWAKRFGDDFYQEMFRLRGWRYSQLSTKRPPIVGQITNDVVYARLAPLVLEELRRLTPRDEKGRLKQHLHRRLTEDIGHPALKSHLQLVTALMQLSTSWPSFMRKLDQVRPRYDESMALFAEWERQDDTEKTERTEDVVLALPGVKPKDAIRAFMQVKPKK